MSLEELRTQLVNANCNKNDQVITLITARLDAGPRVGTSLVRNIAALGYNPKHVGAVLSHNCGTNPRRHLWRREDDGTYHLHQ